MVITDGVKFCELYTTFDGTGSLIVKFSPQPVRRIKKLMAQTIRLEKRLFFIAQNLRIFLCMGLDWKAS
jgi:hypothetical protein